MGRRLGHKFGAVACERDDIRFPSKLERGCYDWLQILQREGLIRMFLRQVPFDLPGGSKHFVDYCVFTKENVLFLEAKGRDLSMGKMKRKQVESLFDVDIHVVKSAGELDSCIRDHG